jgi:excisionase family DNA binding protein
MIRKPTHPNAELLQRENAEPASTHEIAREFFDNQTEKEWLTTEEAADYLGINVKCLLNLCSNRKVRYYKFGRRNRYLRSDLRRLLLAQPRGEIHGY